MLKRTELEYAIMLLETLENECALTEIFVKNDYVEQPSIKSE